MRGVLVALIFMIASCGLEPSLIPASHVVEIVCAPDGSTQLRDDEVVAGAEGIHVRVQNLTGRPVGITGLRASTALGTTETIDAYTAPGTVEVGCFPTTRETGREPTGLSLTINDPHSHWVDATVSCKQFSKDGPVRGSHAVFHYAASSIRPPEGDPPPIGRWLFSGLKASDVVERAGYREASIGLARLVREGETIAIANFGQSGRRWYPTSIQACVGAGVDVRH